ncbi:hypothetical protein U4E84_10065 [Halorubrum sp. AD140]|uniref:hypothetical protein n=1 Tax=Halorubrum sp. AD140 TaxID=3050073 RepID=UPI002ACCF84A|nr:hypothetical protein [Halorubrum sp. AD140]MDZ5811686.1 hypothetical protein [Halorubrum sp. AD140]
MDRRQPDDETVDDIISRLLVEKETRRSLDEFVKGYLEARGKGNVSQLAIVRPGRSPSLYF